VRLENRVEVLDALQRERCSVCFWTVHLLAGLKELDVSLAALDWTAARHLEQ
jgi:hypothetical protein